MVINMKKNLENDLDDDFVLSQDVILGGLLSYGEPPAIDQTPEEIAETKLASIFLLEDLDDPDSDESLANKNNFKDQISSKRRIYLVKLLACISKEFSNQKNEFIAERHKRLENFITFLKS